VPIELKSRVAVGKGLALGLLAILLVVASLGAVVYLGNQGHAGSQTSSTLSTPAMVNVFGLVSTVGQGTHMVALSFKDTKTGTNFTAPASNGRFSINLPNAAVYDVVARWAGNYSWQAGAVDRGDLTVNMSAGSMGAMSYNLQVETPSTIVAVHGTITWSLPSAQPTSVMYTAADGETFTAAVQNSTFSTRLPNLMDYQVKVFWQYSDGTTDYLFATNQTVNESIGVVGLDLVIN
jgi:hypothetical protein